MTKRPRLIVVSVLAFWAFVGLAAHYVKPEVAAAAQLQKQVQVPTVGAFSPVVIAYVTLGDVVVQKCRVVKPRTEPPDPITPFYAEDDWIRNLTVYLLNRTDKPIVFLTVVFGFPDTDVGQAGASFAVTLGVMPQISFDLNGRPINRPPPRDKPILFGPGETMPIHLADYLDRVNVKRSLPASLAAQTTMSVTVQPGTFFADGMWFNAGYRVFDPETSTWRRMDDGYFPGHPGRNLPGRPGWVDP